MAPIQQRCVHIGFPKTGTTTLQSLVFNRHLEIFNLGKPYANGELQLLVRTLAVGDPKTYDWDGVGRSFQAHVKAALPASGARLIMMSDERLTGNPRVPRAVQAVRLFQLFGDSKILIVIREHRDMLRSMYYQSMRGANVKRHFSTFSDWLGEAFEKAESGPLARLEYLHTVEAYANCFERDRIKVLLFETLLQDQQKFADELSGFLGVDAEETRRLIAGRGLNPRMSTADLRLKHIVARFPGAETLRRIAPPPLRKAARSALGGSQPVEVVFPADLSNRIENHFRAQNRTLAARYDLPLAARGYAV